MAKRFIDTGLWQKTWFRKLAPSEKTAWMYLLTACDSVGVWDADLELAEFCIGASVDWDALREAANENIEVLENGKWWVVDYCEYQYGEELSLACKPHVSAIRLLQKHDLMCKKDWNIVDESHRPVAVRKRITDTFRKSIYARDEYRCQYCGKVCEAKELTLDHIVCLSHNGDNSEPNLVTCCSACNTLKGTRTLEEFAGITDIQDTCSPRIREALHRVSNNLDTLKEKEKELDKEKEKELEKDKDKELYHAVEQAFLSKNDDKFSNYGKEGKAIHGLIGMARARMPDDPGAMLHAMLDAFWRLKTGDTSAKGFWRGQPFLPSGLSPLWDRVLETMREDVVDPEILAIVNGGKT